jgi:hypothetical protein
VCGASVNRKKNDNQKNDNQKKEYSKKENQTLVRLRSLAEIWKLKKIKSIFKHCIFVYWCT